MQLIRRHPQAAPREEAVRLQAKAFRETIAKLLKDRKNDGAPVPVKAEDTVARFFEEIKVLVRDVPERVLQEAGGFRTPRGHRRFRLRPGMMEEMFFHPMFMELSPGMPILMAVSLLRDDFPWIYELGTEFFRAVERRNLVRVRQAGELLIRSVDLTYRGPLSEMVVGPTDEMMSYLHNIARMTDRILSQFSRSVKRERPIDAPAKKKPDA
jgi:hypothetical protein